MKKKIIAVSGGFDPLHSAHCKMIQEASKFGSVVVILNSDEWLIRKKGYNFMSFEERKYILESLKGVDLVIEVDDSDGTVCKALLKLLPNYFANGGDRKFENTPETKICNDNNIKMIWNVGGGKEQSSSKLIKEVVKKVGN